MTSLESFVRKSKKGKGAAALLSLGTGVARDGVTDIFEGAVGHGADAEDAVGRAFSRRDVLAVRLLLARIASALIMTLD